MKKQSITFALFYALILLSSLLKGQVPGHQRGLYVDKFIVLDNGSNISSIFSIVGNSTKEDELLNYCDKNHITYINLSDLYKVFQGSSAQVTTKKAALSAFICKAKSSQHCIQFVGAGVGGFGTIDDINSYNELQTPAFQFQDAERNSPYYSDLSFVEQIIPPTDERFLVAEGVKLTLRLMYLNDPNYSAAIPCTNGAPNNNIDIVTTEYEFWNSAIYYSLAGLNNDYQELVLRMNSVRDLHNNSHPTEQSYIETYLGYLNDVNGTALTCDIASWIDGMYTGTFANYRRVDRILAHYYNKDPKIVYNQSNPSGYYNNRFKNFCEANNDPGESCQGGAGSPQVVSNDFTDYMPIFSSESTRLGSSPSDDFLGDYLAHSSDRNIFTVEKDWYDDFKADVSDPNIHTAPKANNVSPGAAMWFTQSFMTAPLSNPIIFSSLINRSCGSANNQSVTFTYQGPIEAGVGLNFTLKNPLGNIVSPTSGSSISTTLDYNSNPLPTLPSYSLPIDPLPYVASLILTYTGGCSYEYKENIYITDKAQIHALNRTTDALGPFTICEGTKIILKANQIPGATYQWQIDGRDMLGATSDEFVDSVSGSITCKITSGACISISNAIVVTVTSNPEREILISCGGASCSNGNKVTLTVHPNNDPSELGPGDTYLWSTSSTDIGPSIDVCDANRYSVRVSRNG